jgi:protein-disulfide isomerase
MSKNDSRQARQLAEQEAARRRRTRNILIGAVVAIVVVAGIIAWASNRTETDTTAAVPAGVDSGLGVPVGTASSPVVDIYEDFQCPICKTVEDNIGAALQQIIDNGDARVVYHIMSFLDNNLRNDSSTRAANAAGCAQDQGVFPAYHAEVFANQPAVEGDGYTDEQLITFGETAGVADMEQFRTCVTEGTFAGWVTRVERRAEDDQISGTPTILVDGTRVDLGQASSWEDYINQLKAAIQQAG